jgi:hypothetical protein
VFDPPHEVVAYVRRVEPSTSRRWTAATAQRVDGPINCSVSPSRRSSLTIHGWCSHFAADPTARDAALDLEPDGVDVVRLCDTP